MTGTKKRTGNFFSLLFTIGFIFLITAAIIPCVKGADPVDLGTAGNFAVLAKSAITDNIISDITGDVGLSPTTGAAIVGFDTCAQVSGTGTIYKVNAAGPLCATNNPTLVGNAVVDMVSAYSNANSGTTDFPTIGGGELGGRTLTPGNYSWTGAVTISTTDVTLDGQGNADAVWIFKTTSALTTDAGRTIILRGGAQPNNIFWVVAGYTNIGVNSVFNGNILGGEYITIQNSATLNGRALSQTAVTLEKNTVTLPVTRSAPLADFTFTNATGTEPLTVVFTDTSSADITGSIISWAWDFNDDGTIESTQRNPVYLYDTAGIYTPNLTVTDSFGAVATKFDTVTVYQPPVADFTFTPAGGPAYLTVAFTDTSHADPALTISSWAWDFDNDGNADNTTRNPEYTYYAEGDHPVNLTVTDNLGAIGTKFDTVTVDPPVLGITITNAPITLALNPDMTTTSTAIQFYVNSTTNWEVTALDADPDTSGFMTSYSGTTYTPANHLIEPFMVLNRGDVYVPLPFGIQVPLSLKIGSPEQSDTAYTLGVQQAVKMADPHLSVNDYRIVVTLTITSL